MTLDFKVHEQTLEGIPTTSVPRDKSQNYIKLRFHFDKSWDLFKENGAHITVYCQDKKADPAVSTPTIIYETDDWTLTLQDYYASLDDFLIMVVGVSADGTVSCPTNALCVTLDKSGTAWTLNPESPDDPAYVQLLAEVGAAIAEVEGDLAKKENAYINIQEYYDAWIAEHPSGDVEDFIKTIADVGKYTFSDYDSEYYYELKDAAQSDEGHRYYGLLEAYDGGTANIIRYVYCGETVADLARETDVELVDKKYLTDNHYVSATVSAAPTGTEMQEVYKSAAGKLVTPAGGGLQEVFWAAYPNPSAAPPVVGSTFSEVTAQIDGNKAVFVKYNSRIYHAEKRDSDYVYFASDENAITYFVKLSSDNEWTNGSYPLQATAYRDSTIPDNPSNAHYPSSLAVKTYVDAAIGDAIGGAY